MPAEGKENPLLKKGNSDAFFREKYLTKNIDPTTQQIFQCLLNVFRGLKVILLKELLDNVAFFFYVPVSFLLP